MQNTFFVNWQLPIGALKEGSYTVVLEKKEIQRREKRVAFEIFGSGL